MKRWWSKPIYHHITFYNEGSSLNDQYSKNNLGIIYTNGFGNVIKKNLSMAKVLFEEAIIKKMIKLQCIIYHICIFMIIQLITILMNALNFW